MGARGRKSKADIALIADDVEIEHRVSPPADLNNEQKVEWLRVVNSMPAEFFTEKNRPLLESHCRHRVALRHVGALIDEAENSEDFNLPSYDRLLKMQERESRCIAMLSVRLGFAKTTAHEKEIKNNSKPWEYGKSKT